MKGDHRSFVILAAMLMFAASFVIAPDADPSEGAAGTSTVIFFGNGGSNQNGEYTLAYTVTTGNVIELPTQIFTRSGYYLMGFTVGSTMGTFVSAGSDYQISGDIGFYAKWVEIPSGSTLVSSAPSSASMGVVYSFSPYDDRTLSELQSSGTDWYYITMAMRGATNYTYAASMPSWMTASFEESDRSVLTKQYTLTFSGSPATPGNYLVHIQEMNSASPSNNRDVYWLINVPSSGDQTVTLSYDANGGSSILTTKVKPVGTAVVLEGSDATSKSGHTLVGWTLPDGKGAYPTYALDSVYTLSGDAVAVARWVSDPDVLVYSMDGGSLENVEAYVVYNDDTVTLHKTGAVKDGYTFLGWRPSTDHDMACAPGLTMSITGANYLEAYFVPEGTDVCKVMFNANGGTGNLGSQSVESGMWIKLPDYGFVRSGYTFLGWSTSQNATEPMSSSEYNVTSDVTLYAVWKQNEVPVDPEEPSDPIYFTVVFDPNGAQQSVDIQYVQYGGYVSEPSGLSRDGHILQGWRNLESADDWSFIGDVVTTDLLLQAVWAEHFTVSIDGLKATVTLQGKYASINNGKVNWGDGETSDITNGSSTHTYKGTISGYIVVSTSYDSVTTETSKRPFAVYGEHIPDYPSVDPDPDDPSVDPDPDNPIDPPTATVPVAKFTVTSNGDGTYTFDASSSVNASVYSWMLDGEGLGSTKTITTKVLDDGEHIVKLTVKSSTGNSHSVQKTFTVGNGGDDKTIDPIYIIVGLAIGIVAILLVARFL